MSDRPVTDDIATIREALHILGKFEQEPCSWPDGPHVFGGATANADAALDRVAARLAAIDPFLTCPYCAHSFEPQPGRTYDSCPGCERAERAERERDEARDSLEKTRASAQDAWDRRNNLADRNDRLARMYRDAFQRAGAVEARNRELTEALGAIVPGNCEGEYCVLLKADVEKVDRALRDAAAVLATDTRTRPA